MGEERGGDSMSWRARTLPSEITSLDILVACRRDGDGDSLIRELQRTRARVRHLWPVEPQLPTDADVIFCEFMPGLSSLIPWVPGDPKATLILVIPPVPPPDLGLLAKCAPHAVLHRPFTTHAVLTSLVVARSQFLYEQRLRGRIDKLDETLRAIRNVERAKAILMAARQIGEDEAYRFMRQQAMTRRVTISAVAAAIVDSHEILG